MSEQTNQKQFNFTVQKDANDVNEANSVNDVEDTCSNSSPTAASDVVKEIEHHDPNHANHSNDDNSSTDLSEHLSSESSSPVISSVNQTFEINDEMKSSSCASKTRNDRVNSSSSTETLEMFQDQSVIYQKCSTCKFSLPLSAYGYKKNGTLSEKGKVKKTCQMCLKRKQQIYSQKKRISNQIALNKEITSIDTTSKCLSVPYKAPENKSVQQHKFPSYAKSSAHLSYPIDASLRNQSVYPSQTVYPYRYDLPYGYPMETSLSFPTMNVVPSQSSLTTPVTTLPNVIDPNVYASLQVKNMEAARINVPVTYSMSYPTYTPNYYSYATPNYSTPTFIPSNTTLQTYNTFNRIY